MKFNRGKRPRGRCLFTAMETGKLPADSTFKVSNWMPSTREATEGTWSFTELSCHSEIAAHQGALTRDFIRGTYDPDCTARSIEWTMVWGYPKGRIHNNRPNMKLAISSAKAVADAVNILKDRPKKPTASKCLSKIHKVSKGIKTSSSSKIAYFANLETREGKCLILDEQVISSILYNRFDQLRLLVCRMLPRKPSSYSCLGEQIADAKRNQEAIYGHYVRTLNRLAAEAGKSAEAIERFLFANGLDRTTAVAANVEWKKIREASS